MTKGDRDSRALPRMRKEQLLALAQEHGLLGLDGLDRVALIDLLRRFLVRDAQRRRVGAPPAIRRKQSRPAQGRPTPAFELDERLVLLVRDSHTLYAYWNAANGSLGESARKGRQLRLRLLDVTEVDEVRSEVAAMVELPLQSWARDYHLPVPRGARDYRVELGTLEADGSWDMLLRSNIVCAPHEGPADELARERETLSPESDLSRFEPRASFAPPPPGPSLFFGSADELPQLEGEIDQHGRYAPPGRAISPLAAARGEVQLAAPFELPRDYGPTLTPEEERGMEEPLFAWHRLADGPPAASAPRHGLSSAQLIGGPSSSARVARATSAAATMGEELALSPVDSGGSLALVLHAHLPFVRHPEERISLEEAWLYEALCETYLPLLEALWRLRDEGCDYRLTLALSPPLLAMWCDGLLRQRFEEHVAGREALLVRERERAAGDADLQEVLAHYAAQLEIARRVWEAVDGDLIAAFGALQRQGYLELMTCAATHAHLPLLLPPEARWAQIAVAVQQHQRLFGVAPRGIWLPECAYEKGIDLLLARAGLRYFVVEAHAVEHARPRPEAGTLRPIYCADSGVAAFARDTQSAEQVWSRESGYPGDAVYRDFYRDIGFDRPREELLPLVPEDGPRRFTGFKYHRITGHTERKAIYRPAVASQRARQHARHFVRARQDQLLDSEPEHSLVVAPYDAELFGHWWHEGVVWLEEVLRQASTVAEAPALVSLGSYLAQHPTQLLARPGASSWGEGGYHAYWLDQSNRWIYPELHQTGSRLLELVRRLEQRDRPEDALLQRAVAQATRELLLAQASDWAFMMRADSAADYARSRTRQHLDQVNALCQQLEWGKIDVASLEALESRDNLFPDLDWRILASA